MKNLQRNLLLAATLLCSSVAYGQLFDETTNGDASNDAANPTVLDLLSGSNFVSGTVTRSNDLEVGDIDFYSFTIDEGQMLEGIFLTEYDPPNDRGFHAINSGAEGIVPSGPNVGETSQYLGSAHLSFVGADVNLLEDLGTPLAGSGFEGPLGPGTYSYIVQQTGPVVSSYSLDFAVVPEPAAGTLVSFVLVAFAICRPRRRRKQ